MLRGFAGEDRLEGGRGGDRIYGGAGDDQLSGGSGADRLHGEGGADGFRFRSLADAGTGRRRDVIHDFGRGRDDIVLAAIDADTTRTGDQDFDFIGAGRFPDRPASSGFRRRRLGGRGRRRQGGLPDRTRRGLDPDRRGFRALTPARCREKLLARA